MKKIRNLTIDEVTTLGQDLFNFECVFAHRFFIVRDVEAHLYKVKVFEEMNNFKDCIVSKTFRTMKQLKSGLNEILEQFS